MRKIEWQQGAARACYHDGFHDPETFDEVLGAVQSSGVCADAQCCKIRIQKWFEEFVSQSNTIQAQEDISVSGKIAGQDQGKLCMN